MKTAGSVLPVDLAVVPIRHVASKQHTAAFTEGFGVFATLVDHSKQFAAQPNVMSRAAPAVPVTTRPAAPDLSTMCYPLEPEAQQKDAFDPNATGQADRADPQILSGHDDQDQTLTEPKVIEPVLVTLEAGVPIAVAPPLPLRQPSKNDSSAESKATADVFGKDHAERLQSPATGLPTPGQASRDRIPLQRGDAKRAAHAPAVQLGLHKVELAVGKVSRSVVTPDSNPQNPVGHELIATARAGKPALMQSEQSPLVGDNSFDSGKPKTGPDGKGAPSNCAPEPPPSPSLGRALDTAVVSSASPSPLPNPPVFHQVARALAGSAATATIAASPAPARPQPQVNARELMIELKPEGLGRILATLTRVSGEVRVRLRPDSVPVAQQLQSDIESLGKALAAAGVVVSDISIVPTLNPRTTALGSSTPDAAPGSDPRGQGAQPQRHDSTQGARPRARRETPSHAVSGDPGSSSKRSYLV